MENKKNKKEKTCKSRRETAVQGTNDSSIVSKCSMAQLGYFPDPFLQEFVSKTTRRAPLIHRGYYIRAKAIDYILRSFLAAPGENKQIISLGAGFDSAYFRLKSAGLLESTEFYEVDYSDVVHRKSSLIKNNSTLSQLIPDLEQSKTQDPLIEINTEGYKLLGADLTQLNTLEALLKLCGARFDSPTLLLSECVMTYMTRRCSTAVIQWAAETFSNAIFVLYEQINPDDAFGLVMQNHFQVIGSPLKCINAYPTLQSQVQRFTAAGWETCEAMDMNQFYDSLVTSEERMRIEHLEPFDEYEEWHLKCAHYMVICAYKGKITPVLQGKGHTHTETAPPNERVKIEFPKVDVAVQRFGHSSVWLKGSGEVGRISDTIVTFGGFGEMEGKHRRLINLVAIETASLQSYYINPTVNPKEIEVSRMHDQSCLMPDGSVILIGGRTSPVKLCQELLMIKFIWDTVESKQYCDSEMKENINISVKECDKPEIEYAVEQSNSKIQIERDSSKRFNEQDVNSICPSFNEPNDLKACDNSSSEIINANVTMDTTSCNTVCQVAPSTSCMDYKESLGLNTQRISSVICQVLDQKGDIPNPRWRHTATPVKIKGADCVLMFGGRSDRQLALNDMYLLQLDSLTWTRLHPSSDVQPSRRHTHSATSWRNYVIISGGLDETQRPLNSVFLFDVESLTWQQINCDTYPRYSHTSHVVDDTLILIGGVNTCHSPPGVSLINLVTFETVEVPLPVPNASHLIMLHRHTTCYLGNGRFIVIGGGGNCFSFGTHLNKSPFIIDISKYLSNSLKAC